MKLQLTMLLISLSFCHGQNMYCGKRECYDILGVEQYASVREIRKQYRKLSLQYHPDKSSDPTAADQFRMIAVAYETLSNVEKRKAYDYYLDHPEDFAYNYGMYVKHVYAPRSDLRLVLFGFLSILTLIQYWSQQTRYEQAIKYFRQSDKVRRKASLILEERRSGSSKRKIDKKKQRKELESIIDELMATLEISGGYGKPRVKDLLLIRILCLPYTLILSLYWHASWFYRHCVLKIPYDDEEQVYLTCRALGITQDCFESDVYDGLREGLIQRQLWKPEQLKSYLTDPIRVKNSSNVPEADSDDDMVDDY